MGSAWLGLSSHGPIARTFSPMPLHGGEAVVSDLVEWLSVASGSHREGNYWFEQVRTHAMPSAHGHISADVVVVGGGIAGLTAARRLSDLGKDVVVLEAATCGSGATGRSSGFITPDSELELRNLLERFGEDDATLLWQAAQDACSGVRADLDAWNLSCDLVDADSFWVARSKRKITAIRHEYEAHQRLGFESRLYQGEEVSEVLGGEGFFAGVRSPGAFGMNAYAYARGLAQLLATRGVRCFERSPAIMIERGEVRTEHATVRAEAVVVCLDRYAPTLGVAVRDDFHAQAFLTLTEPIDETAWRQIFPQCPLLVWDSDVVYQYFRRTGEGRLLVGGGRLIDTYAAEQPHSKSFAKIERYVRSRFAGLRGVRFTHAWQGLIGVSKDLLPIAGRSPNEPSHYLAVCGAGLPWSVLAGECAAECVAGDTAPLERFFTPQRRFNRIDVFQPIMGKPITWALSNYLAKR